MRTEIVGRHQTIDEPLREFMERKLGKLEKFLEESAEARVTLTAERHLHHAELRVTYRGGVLQGTGESDVHFRDAFQRALEAVEEQARRSHQKVVDRRRHSNHGDRGHRWPVEILEQESVGGGLVPRVIETTHLDVKPMTIDEAAIELDVSETGFVVFRDSSNDRLSVLYKRKDRHYGLIAPEI